MIRFMPDTFRDAIWRPLAMASPEGGVYVEIIAPDFRFVFVLALVVLWLILVRRGQKRVTPAIILLGFTALEFVPWLETTGNGRYFIPFLLIVGPLCIGLLQLLPFTRNFRMILAIGMVLSQGYLLHEASPWRTWGHVEWRDAPAFGLEVPPDVAAQPATFVTIASISYSLVFPHFHPASRWINISTLRGVDDSSPEGVRARTLIAAPGPLNVLFPTVPGGQKGAHMDAALGKAIDDLLARQGLSVEDEAQCRLMPSSGLARMASARVREEPQSTNVHGFWLCPLARHASARALQAKPIPSRTEMVFQKLEQMCPRIFRPGEVVSLHIPKGAVRGYPSSDFKLYVFDNGQVWYKYYRALNPVLLGLAEGVLDPTFKMNCDHVQGRYGLPWERGI